MPTSDAIKFAHHKSLYSGNGLEITRVLEKKSTKILLRYKAGEN